LEGSNGFIQHAKQSTKNYDDHRNHENIIPYCHTVKGKENQTRGILNEEEEEGKKEERQQQAVAGVCYIISLSIYVY
jgi:hypothetical protein